jgi:hypothetical protein
MERSRRIAEGVAAAARPALLVFVAGWHALYLQPAAVWSDELIVVLYILMVFRAPPHC